jgi:hypothetical protein
MAEDDTLVMLNNGWPVGSSSSGHEKMKKKEKQIYIGRKVCKLRHKKQLLPLGCGRLYLYLL